MLIEADPFNEPSLRGPELQAEVDGVVVVRIAAAVRCRPQSRLQSFFLTGSVVAVDAVVVLLKFPATALLRTFA